MNNVTRKLLCLAVLGSIFAEPLVQCMDSLPQDIKHSITSLYMELSLGYDFSLFKIITGKNPISSMTFSSDEKKILIESQNETTHLWHLSTDDLLESSLVQIKSLDLAAFKVDETTVLTTFTDNPAHIFEFATGNLLNILRGHTAPIFSLAFSPDKKTVLTGSRDNTAHHVDIKTGELLKTLEGHTDLITAIAFSPDGKTVLTGSKDTTVRLWDLSTGNLLKTYSNHTSAISSVIFSPQGTMIAAYSDNGTIILWKRCYISAEWAQTRRQSAREVFYELYYSKPEMAEPLDFLDEALTISTSFLKAMSATYAGKMLYTLFLNENFAKNLLERTTTLKGKVTLAPLFIFLAEALIDDSGPLADHNFITELCTKPVALRIALYNFLSFYCSFFHQLYKNECIEIIQHEEYSDIIDNYKKNPLKDIRMLLNEPKLCSLEGFTDYLFEAIGHLDNVNASVQHFFVHQVKPDLPPLENNT